MVKSSFDLEKELLSRGYEFVIGIDEVGRGPLAGPVVACAAVLKNHENNETKEFDLVRDSKTLSEKQRENIFEFIQNNFFVGVGLCDHETIDRINILEASFLAMKKAVGSLMRAMTDFQNTKYDFQNTKYMILVDGNKKIPNFSMEQRAIVGGDKIVKSISAASIIAKVTRDRMMKEMHEKYPEYGFDKHKGYGTKFHVEALQKNGPCQIHRKSFEPVKSLVKKGK